MLDSDSKLRIDPWWSKTVMIRITSLVVMLTIILLFCIRAAAHAR
jgi:hypothetical protein